MRKNIFPFIAIGAMAAAFNIICVSGDDGMRVDMWFFSIANIIFMSCNIFAATTIFRNQDK